jgi:hypothetical protein
VRAHLPTIENDVLRSLMKRQEVLPCQVLTPGYYGFSTPSTRPSSMRA